LDPWRSKYDAYDSEAEETSWAGHGRLQCITETYSDHMLKHRQQIGKFGKELHAMEDIFEKRVRAAAIAAWWTILVGVIFLVLQWILYLVFMSVHPAWLLWLWGPDSSWPFVQTVWFWAVALIKAFLWMLAVIALWLTFWSRKLRKQTPRQ
jgi:hypothetical protein